MVFPHGPGGFWLAGGFLAEILAALMVVIGFVVAVGLIFVLVRFLLVATKAAEIYVAKNGPAATITPTVVTTETPTDTTTVTPTAAPTAAPTTSRAATTSRTRTPKSPPTT